jgi:hypothetical protein
MTPHPTDHYWGLHTTPNDTKHHWSLQGTAINPSAYFAALYEKPRDDYGSKLFVMDFFLLTRAKSRKSTHERLFPRLRIGTNIEGSLNDCRPLSQCPSRATTTHLWVHGCTIQYIYYCMCEYILLSLQYLSPSWLPVFTAAYFLILGFATVITPSYYSPNVRTCPGLEWDGPGAPL